MFLNKIKRQSPYGPDILLDDLGKQRRNRKGGKGVMAQDVSKMQ